MSKEDFLNKLKEKIDKAIKDWPEWKHHVLTNSFRSENSQDRNPVNNLEK